MTKPKQEGEQCHCSWGKECRELSDQIEALAPAGHVWKGRCHRWSMRKIMTSSSPQTFFKNMIFLAAMCKHAPGIEEKFRGNGKTDHKKEIVLARHHFPIAVYQFLGSKRITSLLNDAEMESCKKNDISDRLMDDCNRVRRMAALIKQIVPPGPLLDDYMIHELKCLETTENYFICAPVTTQTEVTDVLNEIRAAVNAETVSRLLNAASAVEASSAETARQANLMKGLATVVPKQAPKQPIVPKQAPKQPTVLLTNQQLKPGGRPKVQPVSAQSKVPGMSPNVFRIPVPGLPPKVQTAAKPATVPAKQLKVKDPPPPPFLPSAERCKEEIKAKVIAIGIDKAKDEPIFRDAMALLRRIHVDFVPITLSDEADALSYIYPCKGVNSTEGCVTYRILKIYKRQGAYCEACQKAINAESRHRSHRKSREEAGPSKHSRLDALTQPELIVFGQECRKKIKTLKRQNQRLADRLQAYESCEKKIKVPVQDHLFF
ncbi:hypothetical protein FisN_24Hh243 [Fistulifera solaris]|uniref:Uncharacterized protein n=1 Tax=Fistulifera solaris TaxID=1519565 RepID=A0A1Z5K2M5_FISSO|nr:hypothetical protein FisN_24Hh243 [Fistulifera solaris]|eukprot:GAX20507.1 hypothetical protein FisN_24Hh243 [Fistulifera solaris]